MFRKIRLDNVASVLALTTSVLIGLVQPTPAEAAENCPAIQGTCGR